MAFSTSDRRSVWTDPLSFCKPNRLADCKPDLLAHGKTDQHSHNPGAVR